MVTRFKLEEILEQKGISQHGLARMTGLSYQTVHRLCRNKTKNVALETLDIIAQHLGCKPGDLLRVEPRKKGKR